MNRIILAALLTISFADIANAQTGRDALERGRMTYEKNERERAADRAQNFRFDITDAALDSDAKTYHIVGAVRYELKGAPLSCPFDVNISRGNFIDKTICKDAAYFFDLRIRQEETGDVLYAEVFKDLGTVGVDLKLKDIRYDLK
jgi:hypothetical protein